MTDITLVDELTIVEMAAIVLDHSRGYEQLNRDINRRVVVRAYHCHDDSHIFIFDCYADDRHKYQNAAEFHQAENALIEIREFLNG